MQLVVNGESRQAPDGRTVGQLISDLGLADRAVAVEVNKALIPKKDHVATPLHDGDVVELVTLVGGG